MKALRIVDWDRYMHADCKRSASMPWVKCPTSHTGLGYLEIMEHADGMQHFAAWVLILQVAAKCPPGGVLVTDSGRVIGARELSLKTRGNSDIFKAAIDRLVTVGWLEWIDLDEKCAHAASVMRADCKQPAITEERRGEEIRGEGEEMRGDANTTPHVGKILTQKSENAPETKNLQAIQEENVKALSRALKRQGFASDETATSEWGLVMEGRGGCRGIDEVLSGIGWMGAKVAKCGARITYARQATELIDEWAQIITERRKRDQGAA